MYPIVSFSNEKSNTDQKKSPLRFIPSSDFSDFIIENNCNNRTLFHGGHYLILHWLLLYCHQTFLIRPSNLLTLSVSDEVYVGLNSVRREIVSYVIIVFYDKVRGRNTAQR